LTAFYLPLLFDFSVMTHSVTEPQGPTGAKPPGGGNFPPMEVQIARLEVRVEHIERDIAEIRSDTRSMRQAIERDFRIVWAGIIATNLGLGALMAKGFGWL
jgi:hypothetical protein